MKKVFAWAVVVVMLLTITACGESLQPTTLPTQPSTLESNPTELPVQPTEPSVQPTEPPVHKVVIYIQDTITIYDQTGAIYAEVTYVFEEGWQEKESFTATVNGDTDKLGGTGTTVYTTMKTVMDVSNGAKWESYYSEDGQLIMEINRYADGGRREVTYTYNATGMVVSQEVKMYETADSDAVTTTTNYTYVETEDGYTFTEELNLQTVVTTYDKNGRQTSQVIMMNDQELSRTEVCYDEAGNMVSQVSYYKGQKQMEMLYTWKKVEVSEETAARLPQFNREK